MNPSRRRISVIIVLPWFLLAAVGASAQVTLDGVLAQTGGSLRWDTALAYGTISLGQNRVTIKPGLSFAMLNNRERIETGTIVRGGDGGIVLTHDGAVALESALKRQPDPANAAADSIPRIAAIVIDPGHGGKDPGTSRVHTVNGRTINLAEKNIVLDVAKRLYGDLRQRFPHKRIVLTRRNDTYVSLEQRTEIANSIPLKGNEAMIFVSVHANASFDPKADGFEVWYLPPSYRRRVIDPNSPGTSKELYPILNSMREEEYTIESVLLGRKILTDMSAAVGRAVPDRGLKAESWFVVRNAKMPAVLIELGFVTNEKEAALLSEPSYLQKLAAGIYNGVTSFVDYFDKQSGFME